MPCLTLYKIRFSKLFCTPKYIKTGPPFLEVLFS
nr:MAG TPA: hypothetical protein [Caudoviricetes sp.]